MTRKWKTRENMTTWSGKRGFPPVWFSWSRFLNLAIPTFSESRAWLPHWRSCFCFEPILWEFNSSVLMLRLSFVPMNLHNCWPRDWKGSWTGMLRSEIETLALIASRGNTAFLFYVMDFAFHVLVPKFLDLNSGFQSPGFSIPQAKISRNRESGITWGNQMTCRFPYRESLLRRVNVSNKASYT